MEAARDGRLPRPEHRAGRRRRVGGGRERPHRASQRAFETGECAPQRLSVMSSSQQMSEFSDFVIRLRSRVGAGGLGQFASVEDGADESLRQAAVALVLRGGLEGSELLVIKRSETERDHWSGATGGVGGGVRSSSCARGETAPHLGGGRGARGGGGRGGEAEAF